MTQDTTKSTSYDIIIRINLDAKKTRPLILICLDGLFEVFLITGSNPANDITYSIFYW